MAYSGQLSIVGPDGSVRGPRPVSVEVGDDALSLVPEGDAPVPLAYVDVDDLHDDDYTLRLSDHTGRRYDLTMLGKAYGQIAADVRKRRNGLLQREMLLTGVGLQDTFPGKLVGGAEAPPVEIRLFRDLLVVVPERGTMWGMPYSFVDRVEWDAELYQTRVHADDGTVHAFGQLGRRSEEFRDELTRLMGAMARRTAATLAGLLPAVPPGGVSRLSALMRDGRAVQQRAVDAVDPALWPLLEDAVVGTDRLRESYEALKARCPAGWAALGVKAVLAGGEESAAGEGEDPEAAVAAAVEQPSATAGDTEPETERRKASVLWFFVPLSRDGRPANAVAQEVTSEEGHATYVFRLMEPDRFSSASGEALADAVGQGIARLNRALLTLNFRREPIYASEDEVAGGGRFSRYRVALRNLPHLRWARSAFLGRAVHSATWERQLDEASGRA
ncbi:MAG: hypothetical protein HY658_06455 [Actinobacteria bacterium]|nr:hypothetical protein [Actinomycetota bacterium]